MAIDISLLGTYVQNGKDYAMKSVASATTAKELIASKNVQFGVKGTASINKIYGDVTLIDGSTCGARSGGSTISLANKNLVVKQIADESNICTATMWNTFFADSLTKGQTPQEEMLPAFADAIMTDRAMKIAATNEGLLWQGVLGSTGVTANYRLINGIGTQVTASTATATGSTMVNKLQNFFLACNVTARGQEDFRICVGEDIYAEYKIALAAANIYQPVDDMTLFGTTAKLHVTSGLNGTRKVYGLRWSNLQLGVDGLGDADTAELRYSVETKNWYLDFKYALGVAVIYNTSDEALYATVA